MERHWKPLEVKNRRSQRRSIGRVHQKKVIRSHRKNNNIRGENRITSAEKELKGRRAITEELALLSEELYQRLYQRLYYVLPLKFPDCDMSIADLLDHNNTP